MKKKKSHDPYRILELKKGASWDDIRKAFRRLSMQWHPDRNPGNTEAEEKYKEIVNAYEILSDPLRKAAFDECGIVESQDERVIICIENSLRTAIKNLAVALPGAKSESYDLLSAMRQLLKDHKKELEGQDETIEECRRRLENSKDRFLLHKNKENLLNSLLSSQATQLDHEKALIKEELDITVQALKLLEKYEYSFTKALRRYGAFGVDPVPINESIWASFFGGTCK